MPLLPPAVSRYVPRTRRGRILVVLAGLLLTVMICFYLAIRTPGWYRPADPADIGVIDTAGRMQLGAPARAHTAIQRAASAEQRLAYTQDEINAFLAITYANASGSYKGQVTGPMVYIANGQLTVGARATNIPVIGNAIVSLTGHAEVTPSPVAGDSATRCKIVLDSVHVGSLRIPQALIRNRLDKALGQSLHSLTNTLIGTAAAVNPDAPVRTHAISRLDTDALLQQIARGEPFVVPSYLERKTVYLQAINLTPGRLTIVFAPTPLR